MLTEHEPKYVKTVVVKRTVVVKGGATSQRIFLCCIVIFIVLAAMKFWLSALWLNESGNSLHAFLVRWAAGTSVHENYSGSFIKVSDDLTWGMVYLCMALSNAALWWNGRRTRERIQGNVDALQRGEDIV